MSCKHQTDIQCVPEGMCTHVFMLNVAAFCLPESSTPALLSRVSNESASSSMLKRDVARQSSNALLQRLACLLPGFVLLVRSDGYGIHLEKVCQ